MSGVFISFEGPEGSGKSTQIARLADYLKSCQKEVCLTQEPGGTLVGNQIRHLLLAPENAMAPLTELFLYEASRAEHVEKVIRPALTKGSFVLCDRFFDATVAYQGYGRGLPLEVIRSLNKAATDGLFPDLTLLLDCPEELGALRTKKRYETQGAPDRMELEQGGFHRRVREGYLEMAKADPERFVIIDASQDKEAVSQAIFSEVTNRYPLVANKGVDK